MLAQLSIRAKLVAVVSLLLVSPAAIGVFGLLQMRSQNAHLMDIQTSWLPSVQTLGELRANTITYRVVVRDLVALTDPEARARTEKTFETVTQNVDKVRKAYEPLITSEDERNIYKEFSQAWSSYTAEARDIITMAAKGQNNEARELNSSKVNPIGLKADAALRKGVELNNKGAADAASDAQQEYNRAFWLVLGTLGILTLAGIISAIYLIRDVSRGIASIIAPMRRWARATSRPWCRTGARTPRSARWPTPAGVQGCADRQEGGRRGCRAERGKIQRGSASTITREFEVMVGEMVLVSSASTELEAAANTLTSTAEPPSSCRVRPRPPRATSPTTCNRSPRPPNRSPPRSTRSAARCRSSSRVAQSAVQQAQQTDTSIAELSKAAGRIGDVVKLITAVAEQTNLLALNATIEAARAGEAGRGFAVVASEVKALAAQTAKATEEISMQIEGMQSATETSVTAIRVIGKTIGTISEISLDHRGRGRGTGRRDQGDRAQHAGGGSPLHPGRLQRHRRQQGRRRDRLRLDPGVRLGAVAVEGKRPVAARGRQVPHRHARGVRIHNVIPGHAKRLRSASYWLVIPGSRASRVNPE